jgi:hypothetical protein
MLLPLATAVILKLLLAPANVSLPPDVPSEAVVEKSPEVVAGYGPAPLLAEKSVQVATAACALETDSTQAAVKVKRAGKTARAPQRGSPRNIPKFFFKNAYLSLQTQYPKSPAANLTKPVFHVKG